MIIIGGVTSYPTRGVLKYRVSALAPGTQSTIFQLGPHSEATLEITGTFGPNGTIELEVSRDRGWSWATAVDDGGSDLVFTTPGVKTFQYAAGELFRLSVTGSDGTTSLDVTLLATVGGQ
jgi:hypothetical protein